MIENIDENTNPAVNRAESDHQSVGLVNKPDSDCVLTRFSRAGGRIDEDDFYKKSAEFKQWLREKQGIAFEELDAREARDIFADDFCYLWNRNKLPGSL
jgi:hypothetical protein